MSSEPANSRINNYWERGCIALLTIVVSYMGMAYKDVVNDVRTVNDKIVLLQMDKVGKSDMREMEVRTNSRMDAGFSNLAQRVDSNQQDLMRQLDRYLASIKNKN